MVFVLEELGSPSWAVERVEPPGLFSCRWARPEKGPVEANSTTDPIGPAEAQTGSLICITPPRLMNGWSCMSRTAASLSAASITDQPMNG